MGPTQWQRRTRSARSPMEGEKRRLNDPLRCTDSGIQALAWSESAHRSGEFTKDLPPPDYGDETRRWVRVVL